MQRVISAEDDAGSGPDDDGSGGSGPDDDGSGGTIFSATGGGEGGEGGDPVCFAAGTLILTQAGEVPVEALRPGNLVMTTDGGAQPVRWIGCQRLSFPPGPHRHKPILFRAGSLGPGRPRRDLMVSPLHRLAIGGPVVQALFGETEVLALARGLTGLPAVRAMAGRRAVAYYALLCARHAVLIAEGAAAESFYPGRMALSMIGLENRSVVVALVPGVLADPAAAYGPPARRVLSRRESAALAAALRHRAAEFGRWDRELAADRAPKLQVAG